MLDTNSLYVSNSRADIGPLFKLRIKIHSVGGAREGNGIALQQLVQKDKFSVVLEPKPRLREKTMLTSFTISRGFPSATTPPPWVVLLPLLTPIPQPRTLSLLLSPTPSSKWWSQYLNPDLSIKSSTLSMIPELIGSSSLPRRRPAYLEEAPTENYKIAGSAQVGTGIQDLEETSGVEIPIFKPVSSWELGLVHDE